MLKNKVIRLRKEIVGMLPERPLLKVNNEHQKRRYTLDDWTTEDIRKVIFPEGRECFDPADESLMNKWNETNWLSRDLLHLLSVMELRTLRDWLEKREKERGLANAKK